MRWKCLFEGLDEHRRAAKHFISRPGILLLFFLVFYINIERENVIAVDRVLMPKNISKTTDGRYLVYSTRDDGFNNQLDQFRLAVCAAMRSGRTLVLMPMWYEWSWDVSNHSAYRKFGDFFDIDTLSLLIPTIELEEFVHQRHLGNAVIDAMLSH
jgi:hypothetical protein